MAYNKAKEEKKWRIWKDAEEKKLRELGVCDDTIEQLRVHDWAVFNSDRRYYQRLQDTGTYLCLYAPDLKYFLVFGCYIGRMLLPKSKWEVKHYG